MFSGPAMVGYSAPDEKNNWMTVSDSLIPSRDRLIRYLIARKLTFHFSSRPVFQRFFQNEIKLEYVG